MRCSLATLTAIALLLTCGPVSRAQTPPAGNDHNLKLGVVRIGYIYRNMQESAQAFTNLKARVGQMQQEQAARQKALEDLDNQLKQLKPGSPQWLSMRGQLDDKKLDLDSWGKKMQIELDREKKAALMDQYRHVNEAVQSVAEQMHIDLVISDYTPDIVGPDFDGIAQERLEQLILTRAVLFAGKKADITQEVLTVLDATFAKNRQSIGATPPAPAIANPGQGQLSQPPISK